MRFLEGLAFFVVGIILLFAVFNSKRNIHLGGHSSCLLLIIPLIGAYYMITEVWKFIVGLAAPEPVPIRQAVSTRIPTSAPYHPTSTIRPTQTIAYHPVTWMELASFLTSDPTNLSANNKFNTDYYTCLDFSIDLVENANKENIKAWIVGVNFYNESEGHAFVAFETTDLGVVYIEPQTDHRYEVLQQGEPLCDAWGKYGCMGTVGSYEFIQCDHSHYCTNYTP